MIRRVQPMAEIKEQPGERAVLGESVVTDGAEGRAP